MDKYVIAKALFGTPSAQEPGTATVLYGTAAGDSAGGRVSVLLNGVTYASDDDGSAIDMDTTTDVRAGETVIVTVVDGHPVVTGVVGSGDRLRTDVDVAAGAAQSAQESAANAQSDINQFKADAEATYSTKTETDEKTNAVKETIEATYLKKDDASTTYATKTELTKSADGIKAEVAEEYVTKADASETYVGKSRFEQLATSIKSLVRGEGTYTDPDGVSATSGIYSLITQTRDSVTALFGDYTKTADLASTQAVKDAKKAGTDAASAASAAQSTADGAKATADGLATLIRQDADGVTVGKSADGKTYATGRTRMTDSAFQVLDKAGTVVTQMAKDGASFLAGLVRIVVGTGTLPGNKTTEYISVDAGSGVAGLIGIISRLDAAIDGVTSSLSAGWEQDFGYGVTAIVRKSNTVASAAYLAPDKCKLTVGSNQVTMTPNGFALSKPLPVSSGGTGATSIDAARRNLHISQGSKVCHGHGTPWVTLFESWSEFQQATGCYDSGLPTLVTMNGDWSAFDGTLSGCEICGGKGVYVMAQTQTGIPNISSTQSLRINWICIW